MATRPRAAISWSGGKDSHHALQRALDAYDVDVMVTMVDETGARSRSHGIRPSVLDAQAERLGLERIAAPCAWETYDRAFVGVLRRLRRDGVTHVIFGDILLEAHRAWAEGICARARMTAVEPLWGTPTRDAARAFVESGATAIIIATRAQLLDPSWLGRVLTVDLLDELEGMGIDPCGELGEYHSLVVDSPLFTRPLDVGHHGHVLRSGCYALDVEVSRLEGFRAPRV